MQKVRKIIKNMERSLSKLKFLEMTIEVLLLIFTERYSFILIKSLVVFVIMH